MTSVGRRSVLMMAAGAGLAALPLPLLARTRRLHRWRGVLMGAEAEFVVAHESEATAGELARTCVAEARRLERIFSLYDEGSAVRRLNRAGRLPSPPPELVEVLALSRRVWRASGGAFDPTVQPLWDLHARRGEAGAAAAPRADEIRDALARVGLDKLDVSSQAVAFRRPGMALTLNGIAQGWITDRVTDLLRDAGLEHALVQMGETHALGRRPGAAAWEVTLGPAAAAGPTLALKDAALAVSSPGATPLPGPGGANHMFDPATGASPPDQRLAAVRAPRAAVADALSTALALRGPGDAREMLRSWPGTTAWMRSGAGLVERIESL